MAIKLTDQHKIKILNSEDIFRVMLEILLREEKIDQEKEHFWMIGLARNNMVQYIEMVSLGSVNSTTIEPMNVFRVAVMKGSVKVIMVHNHPSGELIPSEEDKDTTDRLFQVGRILNVPVIDHLIISTESYYSFTNSGLLEEISHSTKWVPQYELIERIRKEEKKIREEMVKATAQKSLQKGENQKALEIAKNSLKEGLPIELIVKLTGLTKKEIEKIKN